MSLKFLSNLTKLILCQIVQLTPIFLFNCFNLFILLNYLPD